MEKKEHESVLLDDHEEIYSMHNSNGAGLKKKREINWFLCLGLALITAMTGMIIVLILNWTAISGVKKPEITTSSPFLNSPHKMNLECGACKSNPEVGGDYVLCNTCPFDQFQKKLIKCPKDYGSMIVIDAKIGKKKNSQLEALVYNTCKEQMSNGGLECKLNVGELMYPEEFKITTITSNPDGTENQNEKIEAPLGIQLTKTRFGNKDGPCGRIAGSKFDNQQHTDLLPGCFDTATKKFSMAKWCRHSNGKFQKFRRGTYCSCPACKNYDSPESYVTCKDGQAPDGAATCGARRELKTHKRKPKKCFADKTCQNGPNNEKMYCHAAHGCLKYQSCPKNKICSNAKNGEKRYCHQSHGCVPFQKVRQICTVEAEPEDEYLCGEGLECNMEFHFFGGKGRCVVIPVNKYRLAMEGEECHGYESELRCANGLACRPFEKDLLDDEFGFDDIISCSSGCQCVGIPTSQPSRAPTGGPPQQILLSSPHNSQFFGPGNDFNDFFPRPPTSFDPFSMFIPLYEDFGDVQVHYMCLRLDLN